MMGFTDNCAFTIGSHMTKTLISEQVSCELSHACRTKIANIDHEQFFLLYFKYEFIPNIELIWSRSFGYKRVDGVQAIERMGQFKITITHSRIIVEFNRSIQ